MAATVVGCALREPKTWSQERSEIMRSVCEMIDVVWFGVFLRVA